MVVTLIPLSEDAWNITILAAVGATFVEVECKGAVLPCSAFGFINLTHSSFDI
jgi:hypothetical protein